MAGGDWLNAVGPADAKTLRGALQAAAAGGGTGSTDVRLTGASRTQWSRWWWRAGPTGYLIVCAGESAEPGGGDAAAMTDTLGTFVHRLLRIGLDIQSVTGHTDDLATRRLQHTVDELDGLISDARSAAFILGRPQ